jgi:hypothetical protein
MAAPEWRFWLCEKSSLDQIAELDVKSRQLQPALNNPGTFTGWVNLLDSSSAYIENLATAIRADRDNVTQWSGPIYNTVETTTSATGSNSGNDQNQITAMGWLQELNMREIHTGAEFAAMLTASNGIAYQEQYGPYQELGVDIAQSLAYSSIGNPLTTDAAIIFDLLARANIDCPTTIIPGKIYGAPAQRNLTLQQFQNVGQQITQLVNTENGCDIYVDPVTRELNIYGPGSSPSPTIRNGLGFDRGAGCLFTVPGNCLAATRTRTGTQTNNRYYAQGPNGVGRADDYTSQSQIGLYEMSSTLSDVTDQNILIAYANEEVTIGAYPWTTISFTPRAVAPVDSPAAGVPRPYDDYLIGDIVYALVDRGSMQIGSEGAPQATRIFSWTMNLDDNNSVEKITNVTTTYQGISS